MAYTIENDHLKIEVASAGAELKSIVKKKNRAQYIWNGSAEWWPRSAPVLFPIVGKLNNNAYQYQGKTYSLPQHGFARDQEFVVRSATNESIALRLTAQEDLMLQYPFPFTLTITYSLNESDLHISYEVANTGKSLQYFSIGAHPGFALAPGETLNDYYLEFEHAETASRYLLENGLFTGVTEPVLNNTNRLDIDEKLFLKDAIVFKNMKSTAVSLKSRKSAHALTYSFEGFPYFGIWSKPGAPFLCLEPWCGLADPVGFQGDLSIKEGITRLEPGAVWVRNTTIKVIGNS
jgi:galactose mutarotase-like enzyme